MATKAKRAALIVAKTRKASMKAKSLIKLRAKEVVIILNEGVVASWVIVINQKGRVIILL